MGPPTEDTFRRLCVLSKLIVSWFSAKCCILIIAFVALSCRESSLLKYCLTIRRHFLDILGKTGLLKCWEMTCACSKKTITCVTRTHMHALCVALKFHMGMYPEVIGEGQLDDPTPPGWPLRRTTYLCTTSPMRMRSKWHWISCCGEYWQQAELRTDGACRIMMMMMMMMYPDNV